MATKKITDLVELISAASGDVLPIVDISDDITKKIQVSIIYTAAAIDKARYSCFGYKHKNFNLCWVYVSLQITLNSE
jgi:hypothetical protein